jgi:anaerobic magnesium-protoporphyrin IX monomethyl ester cyclase
MTRVSESPSRRKVLLLNPPAPELVIRDYYCSKTTKSNYIFHPIDLLIQSGRLAENYEVRLIDAVVDRLSPRDCLDAIERFAPDAVLFLSGAISWTYDFPFLQSVKERLGGRTLLIGSGDIFQEDAVRWLEEFPFIDAVIRDFTNADVLNFLEGLEEELDNIVFRKNDSIVVIEHKRARKSHFDLPLPRHELFMNDRYRFSFTRQRPFATVLTDFGCPYPCSFCIMSTLGSKFRRVDHIMEELRQLKALGIKDVFFIDQTWGVDRKRNLELCRRMVEEKLDLGWVTYTRVDVVDEEVLAAWRDAGCHTLIFGVEFASPEMLKRYRKGYRPKQIEEGLALTQRMGIRTVGTFILGLPEDTIESIEATTQLACDLPLDFASFNVAVPRHGTPLRQQARDTGLIDDLRVMDQAGLSVAMPTQHLSREDVMRLKRRAILRFYLRPSYLWKRLTSVSSLHELRAQVQEGAALLSRATGIRSSTR